MQKCAKLAQNAGVKNAKYYASIFRILYVAPFALYNFPWVVVWPKWQHK